MRPNLTTSALIASVLIVGPSTAAGRAGDDLLCRFSAPDDGSIAPFVVKADRKSLCVEGECRPLAAPDRTHRQFRCGDLELEHRCFGNPMIVSSGGPWISEELIVIDLVARTFEGEASGQAGDRSRFPYSRKFSGACEPTPPSPARK